MVRSSTHRLAVHLRGVIAAAAAPLGITAALVMGAQVGVATAAPFTWSPVIGVPEPVPANAGSEPKAHYDWGTCSTAGSCVGVGTYTDEAGNVEALAATRTDGSWGEAVEIALPAGAATSGQAAGFKHAQPTVACTGPGDCVAVGHYMTEGNSEEGMAVTETDGVWGTASEIKPPANAASNPETRLESVACPAAGSCVADGEYRNQDGQWEAMVAVETSESWSPASAIELPANAASSPISHLWSVACSAVGSCVAVGEYLNGPTDAYEAMVVSETDGIWGQASQLTLPANAGSQPRSFLQPAVCVASGPCFTVGAYTDRSGSRQAMVAEEADGSWSEASELTLPANAASNPEVDFSLAPYTISCPASGACVVVVKYTDSSGDEEVAVTEETGGLWGQASEIALPANAASNPYATLDPACGASGSCVLVGAYTDAAGAREAMVAEGAGGFWGQASEIAGPANAATDPEVIFGVVQCPALGSCVAFGEYTNHAGAARDMEVAGMTAPENTLAPSVSGTGKVSEALTCSKGTWAGSPTSYTYKWLRNGVTISGAESSMYTVAAADEGSTISCEVTATNPAGSNGVASANSVAVREEAREKREAEAAVEKRQEEETALAAAKHQEDVAVAAKKRQEEEVATLAGAGRVSLTGSTIGFQSNGKGSVKLTCTGTATCVGKLTLTVKKGKKARAEQIGAAAFSIAAGKSKVVTITLTATGRALLKADHGKLSASLAILEVSPGPTSTKHESIQLVQKKAAKAKERRG